MKDIVVAMDDEALEELRRFMYLRKVTGNTVGPDYQILRIILAGFQLNTDVLIRKDALDKLEAEGKG